MEQLELTKIRLISLRTVGGDYWCAPGKSHLFVGFSEYTNDNQFTGHSWYAHIPITKFKQLLDPYLDKDLIEKQLKQ